MGYSWAAIQVEGQGLGFLELMVADLDLGFKLGGPPLPVIVPLRDSGRSSYSPTMPLLQGGGVHLMCRHEVGVRV